MRWLRLYDDVINDPKVLRLPEATRWHWVAVLCVASKHDGALPPLDELAFYLRTTPAKATVILAALVKGGLLDKTETGFAPHNWSGRQYKSDGSAERVKRHREKRAAAGLQSQWTAPKALRQAVYDRDGHKCVYCGSGDRLSLDHRTPEIRGGTHDFDNLATACLSCNGAKRDMTETEYRASVTLLKRPQNTENREQTEDRIGDARASSFTQGSKALSDALWKALGFKSPLEIPPELAGADWRAIEWEKSGWTPDLIDAQTRKVGPGKPLIYYEKVFATEFAKRQAPLPVVEVRQAEHLTVTKHGTTQAKPGVAEVARRFAEQFESQSGNSIAGNPDAVLRIPAG
jgi:hypothetical protein